MVPEWNEHCRLHCWPRDLAVVRTNVQTHAQHSFTSTLLVFYGKNFFIRSNLFIDFGHKMKKSKPSYYYDFNN